MDPDVMADPNLRWPVEDAFAAARDRLARVLDEGRGNGELDPSVDPAATALVAVLQGGYVLARAAGSENACTQAVDGVLGLLACRARLGRRGRMTGIRRTTLLTHRLHAVPERVEAYRVELPPGRPAGPLSSRPVTGYVESGLIAFERDGQPMRKLWAVLQEPGLAGSGLRVSGRARFSAVL